MNKTRIGIFVLTSVLAATSLLGCSSSEEQQAKYLQRAQEKYEQGEFKKSQLELRNVFQINAFNPQARYLRAVIYMEQEEWKQAAENLTLAVEYAPDFVEARVKLANIYLQMGPGADEQTQSHLDAALELEPDNAEALGILAQLLYRQDLIEVGIEKAQRGIAEAKRARAIDPGNLDALKVLARHTRGDIDGIVAMADEAIAHDPEDPELRMYKIRVLATYTRRNDEVIAEYRNLMAQYPDDLSYYLGLADFLLKRNLVDETEELLRELIASKPDNTEVKLWLAQFLAQTASLDEAEAVVQGYVEEYPDEYAFQFALAEIYRAAGNLSGAIAIYEDIVSNDVNGADSLRARNHLVHHKLSVEDDVPGAEALLGEIFAIEENNTDALLVRARLKLNRAEIQSAIIDLRTVVKNDPESERGLLLLTEAYAISDSIVLAMDTYKTLVEVNPQKLNSVFGIAVRLIDQDKSATAEKLLLAAQELEGTFVGASYMLVELYRNESRFEDALNIAHQLGQRPGQEALASQLRGETHLKMGDYELAQQALRKAVELNPLAAGWLQSLVEAMVRNDDTQQAITFLEKHVDSYPEQAHAYDLLGSMYMRTNNVPAAIASFESALEQDPNRQSTLMALAQAYHSNSQPEAALESYNAALAENPKSLAALILKAGFLETQAQYQEAADTYEKALDIDANNLLAANNLAILLVERLKSKESVARAIELMSLFADSKVPNSLDTRGWVSYHAQDYTEAVALLKKAVELDDTQNIYKFHLGMAYLKLGEKDAARAMLRESLANDEPFPGKDEAIATLKAL